MRITPKSNGGSPNAMVKKKQNMEEEVNRIIKVVCDYFGLSIANVMAKDRSSKLSTTRHFIRYFIKANTDLSLKQIAKLTNCADHATVINSINKVNDLILFDKEYKKYHYELLMIVGEKKLTFGKVFTIHDMIKAFNMNPRRDSYKFEQLIGESNNIEMFEQKQKQAKETGSWIDKSVVNYML